MPDKQVYGSDVLLLSSAVGNLFTWVRDVLSTEQIKWNHAAHAREAEAATRLAQGEDIPLCLVKDGSRGDDGRELQLMFGVTAK